MKWFLDTSVLVAAFYLDHPHHEPSFELFARATPKHACCAAHTLAEVYAVMTRLPVKPPVAAEQAVLFLETMRARLTIVALNEGEYFDAIEQAAARGVVGGKIYDALIVRCAVKSRAETIHTWNIADFTRLAPEATPRVRTP